MDGSNTKVYWQNNSSWHRMDGQHRTSLWDCFLFLFLCFYGVQRGNRSWVEAVAEPVCPWSHGPFTLSGQVVSWVRRVLEYDCCSGDVATADSLLRLCRGRPWPSGQCLILFIAFVSAAEHPPYRAMHQSVGCGVRAARPLWVRGESLLQVEELQESWGLVEEWGTDGAWDWQADWRSYVMVVSLCWFWCSVLFLLPPPSGLAVEVWPGWSAHLILTSCK